MNHFSHDLNMFRFWREGGGGKGNRRMTNHMRIQLGPAHSSPIMQTVCVYEPAGNIQRGTALHLLCLYQSKPLSMAKVIPGKVVGSAWALCATQHPLSSTTVPSGWKSGSRVCLQNLNLAKGNKELQFRGVRTALRFTVVSFQRSRVAQMLQEWGLQKKVTLKERMCCHPIPGCDWKRQLGNCRHWQMSLE